MKTKLIMLLLFVGTFTACDKEDVTCECEKNEIENEAPSDIILDNSSITENEETGTLIGTLTVIDQNSEDQHVFTLTSGGDFFKLENNKLISRSPFDYEEKQSYNITVNVSDGNGGIFNKDFVINIINEDDNYLLGTWRGESSFGDYWFQFQFNQNLTGIRTDSEGEKNDFTYTYTNNKINFTTGFPNGEYAYEINNNTLTLFGDELIKQ